MRRQQQIGTQMKDALEAAMNDPKGSWIRELLNSKNQKKQLKAPVVKMKED